MGLTAGCATRIGEVAGAVLQSVGLKGEALPSAKTVPLRMHAGFNLNAGEDGQGNAVVVRMFKLREVAPFMSAPYVAFGNTSREREALGDSLMEVREVVLTPGQQLESSERLSGEAAFLGLVVLFRNPAPERWRVAFARDDLDKAGAMIGMHRCAMTVTIGKVHGMNAAQLALLTPTDCGGEQRPREAARD